MRQLQRGLPRVRPRSPVLGQPRPRAARRATAGPRRRWSCAGRASDGGRVAIVGAGPAGLECAIALAGRRDVVLFDARDAIGGAARGRGERARTAPAGARCSTSTRAALERARRRDAPRARACGADDLDGFDEVVLAIGSDEMLPALPGIERALPRPRRSRRARCAGAALVGRRRLRLVAVRERGRARRRRGLRAITVATPGAAFGATLPPEGRVQLLARLRGAPLDGPAVHRARRDRRRRRRAAQRHVRRDRERRRRHRHRRRRARSARLERARPGRRAVRVIGDALVPRKATHAIAEGRAAAGRSAARVAQGAPRGPIRRCARASCRQCRRPAPGRAPPARARARRRPSRGRAGARRAARRRTGAASRPSGAGCRCRGIRAA